MIELQDLETSLSNIETAINSLQQLIVSKRKTEECRIDILERKFNKTRTSISNLMPYIPNRLKRGLFDPLGTFIKSITGNLDQKDYEEIQQSIKNTADGQFELINKFNEQIKINDQVIQRFEETTSTINQIIDSTKKIMSDKIDIDSKFILHADILMYYTIIDDNIQILFDHAQEIHEIITFAKINVISRFILDNEEMSYVLKDLEKNNIRLHSQEQVYSLLKVKAYYNSTNLVVIIEIPQFHKEIFLYNKIKTYIMNDSIIPNSYNHIISHKNMHMTISKPCQNLEQVYYCQLEQLQHNNNTCIPNLLNNQAADCKLVQAQYHDETQLLEDGYLFMSSRKGEIIYSTCGPDSLAIQGDKLLKFSDCTIKTSHQSFSNYKSSITKKYGIIQPLNTIRVNETKIETLDIPYLTKANIKNIQEMQIHQQWHFIYSHTYAISSIVLIILTFIFLFFLYKKYRNRLTKFNRFIMTGKAEDSFNLRGEELTSVMPQIPKSRSTIPKSKSTPHLAGNM